MDILPLVDESLGNSAYVVDLGDGGGLIVDPQRDPRPYLGALERYGLIPRFVVETHLHADFVSGGRELAGLGARLAAPVGSGLSYPHLPLEDGVALDLGGLTLEPLATPGHTPEHLAYLLRDGARPVALFSGGALIPGGVARTDLLTPDATESLARQAFRSIRDRLFALPDDLPVHPTHGGGSFCTTTPGDGRSTTIGAEKASSPLLADDPDEDVFVARLLGGYGSFPPYFLELREVNRVGVAVHGPTPPRLPGLQPADVERAMDDGAELVDVRPIEAFANGHLPGALSIPWRPGFMSWLGWLVPRERPVVFVTDDLVTEQDLVWAALTIGFEAMVGSLAGGMSAWRAAGRPVATTALVGAADADGRRVLDIRQRSEYEAGHVSGAVSIELGELERRIEQVGGGPLLVHCGHGERAMSAASLLERAGREDVAVLAGGPADLDRDAETGA